LRWRQVSDKAMCGASSGGVTVETSDGRAFKLVLKGLDLAGVALREIRVDGRPLLIDFSAAPDRSIAAPLDEAFLSTVANGHILMADWPEAKGASFDLTDLWAALPETQQCAAQMAARRAAAAAASRVETGSRKSSRVSVWAGPAATAAIVSAAFGFVSLIVNYTLARRLYRQKLGLDRPGAH
jgi:hypothetical protein